MVVHCKKAKYDVYIGRPSKWGNPFTIGKDGTREEVIEKYERWIRIKPHLLNSLHELKGKTLGCWCAPKACHGDVLERLANEEGGKSMEATIQNAIILKLTLGEARWLKAIVQNPLHGDSPDEEPQLDRRMRKLFWSALKEIPE